MKVEKILVLSAVAGVLAAVAGCGAKQSSGASSAPSTDQRMSEGKAACGGPAHSDKNHCAAAGDAGTTKQ